MKALISPSEGPINYISGWTETKPYQPIGGQYPNSARVAQVEPDDQIFPVGGDLFWTDCPDNCFADGWWYDMVAQTIQPIDNAPQPTVQGVQSV
jgi:hypothetical protein